ncbi:uncharacterized protein [Spinacia oleracea]|uniref:BZIP domain-containing protein n=1 Tax=Spinacia oleracea TaxID=3562 RepID=A0A9R0J2L9_SPIOL|nr:uncharacterized protein LOC110798664 [Spinacia oleracea]
MSSKQQAERLDAQAMQREKERERRRLRDRIRRQNMSQEQRDKHLARRRRNYQLRRLRAQNAKLPTECQQIHAADLLQINNLLSATSPMLDDLPSSSETQEGEAQNMRKTPRRLRVSDIRHLARRLHGDDQQQNGELLTNCVVTTKRLRLTHVKRLARAVKLTDN